MRTFHVWHAGRVAAYGHLDGQWREFLRSEFPHGARVMTVDEDGWIAMFKRRDRHDRRNLSRSLEEAV